MQNEYDALIKNGTWKLVDPPVGTKLVGFQVGIQEQIQIIWLT